jgi:hypothetical protein
LAAEQFRAESFHDSGSTTVHSPPLVTYLPSVGFVDRDRADEIQLVHLNGIAGAYHLRQRRQNRTCFIDSTPKSHDELLKLLFGRESEMTSLLTFAWERGEEAWHIMANRIQISEQMVRNTNILVIIGYSFPFFNREFDKKIFEALKEEGSLKAIYFQDPVRDGEFLRNQFQLSERIPIRHIPEVDNYFVPMEL